MRGLPIGPGRPAGRLEATHDLEELTLTSDPTPEQATVIGLRNPLLGRKDANGGTASGGD